MRRGVCVQEHVGAGGMRQRVCVSGQVDRPDHLSCRLVLRGGVCDAMCERNVVPRRGVCLGPVPGWVCVQRPVVEGGVYPGQRVSGELHRADPVLGDLLLQRDIEHAEVRRRVLVPGQGHCADRVSCWVDVLAGECYGLCLGVHVPSWFLRGDCMPVGVRVQQPCFAGGVRRGEVVSCGYDVGAAVFCRFVLPQRIGANTMLERDRVRCCLYGSDDLPGR